MVVDRDRSQELRLMVVDSGHGLWSWQEISLFETCRADRGRRSAISKIHRCGRNGRSTISKIHWPFEI